MDIEEAVGIHGLAHPGLAALIGTRLHHDHLPDDADLPALVFFLVDDPHDHVTDLGHARFQFTSWAASPAQAKAVDVQVDAAYTRYKGMMAGAVAVSQGVTVAGPYPMPTEETKGGGKRYGRARDIQLHYQEG